MAPSESPTVNPNLIVLFAEAFIPFSPLFGSPADCESPVGFASPDRSGFAFVTKCRANKKQ
jgi:hypothetical protein